MASFVLPAIDISEGVVVRLEQGEFHRRREFGDDPAAVARRWVEMGAGGLHIVDLDGARTGRPSAMETAALIVEQTGVRVQYGGGLRTTEAVAAAAACGLRPIVGTAALTEPGFLERALIEAPDLVVAIDVRGDRVAIRGWTGTGVTIAEAVNHVRTRGGTWALVTDVTRDGTLTGPNLDLARFVASMGLSVIAAGGISVMEDVWRLAGTPGISACVVGMAIYEGTIDPRAAFAVETEGRRGGEA